MDAAGNEDRLPGLGGLLVVCGVHANTQGGYVTAFVAYSNVDSADVCGEHGSHQTHPWVYDGEWLVVLEEDVALARSRGRSEVRRESIAVGGRCRVGRWVGVEDCLCEADILEEWCVGVLQRCRQQS